ncbi:Protein O-mannosyl-transferase 1 [Trichoplax sp. H2]|nr:Protein O-mannosyl-transferase 1 [Trichoplax sp. H2]|eukprot:RDD43436.1 Protein O-mannosyl-transferase 1 [Trichoplax sp. H2]
MAMDNNESNPSKAHDSHTSKSTGKSRQRKDAKNQSSKKVEIKNGLDQSTEQNANQSSLLQKETTTTSASLHDRSANDTEKYPSLATVDNTVTESQDFLLPYFSYKVKLELDVMLIGLTFLCALTRFYNLCHPSNVIFDEILAGKALFMYGRGIFFIDAFPPLAKLLYTFVGNFAGYNGNFTFEPVGTAMPNDVPIQALRSCCAFFATMHIPLIYSIMQQLGHSRSTASVACILVIFDNALLTQSRFMLLEPILLFFILASLYCYLLLRAESHSRYHYILIYLLKYSSGFSPQSGFGIFFLLVCAYVEHLAAYDLWLLIADRNIKTRKLWSYCGFCFAAFIVVPAILYAFQFYIHFKMAPRSGPQDQLMSSKFQASLKGGLASVVINQPKEIVYGSKLTLRQIYTNHPCWLHSHEHIYPIKYPDGRGSSGQQQVTCYTYKDPNNWWIIKDPKSTNQTVETPHRAVKDGDIIQLVHVKTNRTLNSHNVASPVTPTHQEVACFVHYNKTNLVKQDLWQLKIENPNANGTWTQLNSRIRFIHLATKQALTTSGKQLPNWGFYQLEVVTDRNLKLDSSLWNVEEHKIDGGKFIIRFKQYNKEDESISMPFLDKFLEMQRIIYILNFKTVDHEFASDAASWPLLKSTFIFWFNTKDHRQIHLLGNPIVWWICTFSLCVYIALVVFYMALERRQIYVINRDVWHHFCYSGTLLMLGWAIHFVPYFFIWKNVFIHFYLPSLLFKILLLSSVIDHISVQWTRISPKSRLVFTAAVVSFLGIIAHYFIYFAGFSYGNYSFAREELQDRKWRDDWEFIVHRQVIIRRVAEEIKP